MVAMTMTPRRRNQSGRALQWLARGGLDVLPAIGAGLRQPIDDALTLELLKQ